MSQLRGALPLDFGRVQAKFPVTKSWELTSQWLNVNVESLVTDALHAATPLHVIDIKGTKTKEEKRKPVTCLPGHQWFSGVHGPVPSDVMIIGKLPGFEEVARERNFCGNSGEELSRAFRRFGVDPASFYVTNVVRFQPPDDSKSLKTHHIKDCAPLLAHELLLCRPKFILLLGSDALKWMYGRKATLKALRGVMLPYSFETIGEVPRRNSGKRGEMDAVFGTNVMVSYHPAAVLHEPSTRPEFEADIEAFVRMISGDTDRRAVIAGFDKLKDKYHVIDSNDKLDNLIDDLIDQGVKTLAVDCEWAGQSPYEESSWLRTIQFAWGPEKSAVAVLRRCGGAPAMDQFKALDSIRRLIDRKGVCLLGHNFRADALWLEEAGIPAMRRLAFDTMLAQHVLNETIPRDLSSMTLRYTNMGRYDFELETWKRNNPQPEELGYGWIPDEILLPYAAADTDATFRIFKELLAELSSPKNADLAHLFWTIEMPANHGIHEMERNGLLVDTDRMIDLLWRYMERKRELLSELREMIHWPEFNPRSHPQKVRLLFGDPEDGGLGLMPIKSTEKPNRPWAKVLQLPPNERDRINPAVDMETLELLSVDAPMEHQRSVVELLRKFQIIDQITKNFLRPPDGHTEDSVIDYTLEQYSEGLLGHVGRDGRIRTSIDQCKETGRYGSRAPNLQNISKRQEPKYQEIMGESIPTLRSCFIARPGYVLVESDFKSAEIVSMAYVSGDPNLIEDATGPIKLHAKIAVDILGAPHSYHEVADAAPNLYISAKNINFGIPYQRGAKAIARQVNRETKGEAEMTDEAAQEFIDAWYARYSMFQQYVDQCKYIVTHPPYFAKSAYKRRRHFQPTDDDGIVASQHRECVNFGIQSLVADALSRAIVNLWLYKRRNPWCEFHMLLAIHDAVIIEVPVKHLAHVWDVVLPKCMCHDNWVPQLENGHRFKLDTDPELYLRWGEKPKADELAALGVPERFWPKKK